uniref:CBF-like transcription factor n=1 Tax=Chimonanthus praecox TaxID=13419 RepID=A0A4Y5QZ73_9MAGN|nr:CBF-like transcription factor [Chimonanthus praecox]
MDSTSFQSRQSNSQSFPLFDDPESSRILSDQSSHAHQLGVDEEDEAATLATSPPKRRAGRKKFRETRHPVYRGVRRRNSNKWVCEVREPNKKSRIWLGTFPSAEMAARAHDVAAIALRGKSACINFADSAWRLPMPARKDAKDIQKAAAEAAEGFRPSEDVGTVLSSDQEKCDGEENKSSTMVAENLGKIYMEEEADFGMDMPGLIANMAEGMLLSPPHTPTGFNWDDMENSYEVSLWSFSYPIGN